MTTFVDCFHWFGTPIVDLDVRHWLPRLSDETDLVAQIQQAEGAGSEQFN